MTTVDSDRQLAAIDALLDARRYEAALDAVRQIAAVDPANPAVHALGCRALLGLDRHQEAVQASFRAVSLAPGWAHAHRLASIALLSEAGARRARPTDDAVRAARESVRLEPANAHGYATLAEAYAKTGRVKDANNAIRRGIALAPANVDVWVTASLVASAARNWKAAETAARMALAIDPDDQAATNNLGVALERQGLWTIGAVAYFDAARADPRSAAARENVEAIGFRYLATLAPLALLPLLIVAPAFLAARLAVTAWLAKRPRRLRPLARRIGIRIATSKRQRRKFDKRNARVQRLMNDPRAKAKWSASGRHWLSDGFLAIVGFTFAGFGLFTLVVSVVAGSSANLVGLILFAVVLIATGATALWRLKTRR